MVAVTRPILYLPRVTHQRGIENTMAKKKIAKKSAPAAKKTSAKPAPSKPAPSKPAKKSPPKHTHTDECDDDEVELSEIESKAVDAAWASDALRSELEDEASKALTDTVLKVFKRHKTTLTATQAHNVAMYLFEQD